ncbi:hypothetical protein BM525_21045 (plasmid) [Alteromonas mediterranea]|uniref:Uncharacterized protein n=1 Tax=Alteromonas mediterranea TaxID=314275 RepID=A0AAC9JEL9_9ALTE|nr:hypothetical protein [Alteromonas mediterranea]APD92348.1 hypothetical protein BM524_20820 [Alteromonas mediterranea]APE00209.1 hypothetical protein BM525_21045 [Alteromonas mediterranea]
MTEAHINDVQFTKVGRKWAVSRKGDFEKGYKPFELNSGSGDVNLVPDFETKKAAIDWVESGFALDAIQVETGISRIIWAKSWKEAVSVASLPDAYLSE